MASRSGQLGELGARELVLRLHPRRDLGRLLVLEPAIGVLDLDAVERSLIGWRAVGG